MINYRIHQIIPAPEWLRAGFDEDNGVVHWYRVAFLALIEFDNDGGQDVEPFSIAAEGFASRCADSSNYVGCRDVRMLRACETTHH